MIDFAKFGLNLDESVKVNVRTGVPYNAFTSCSLVK